MSHEHAMTIIYGLRSVAIPLAMVAIVNSVLLMGAHCRENRHHALRVYTLRILFMVVIDCVAAVCALWAVGWRREADVFIAAILHFVVEVYESVVIFSFLQFVLACGSGPEKLAARFADAPQKAASPVSGCCGALTKGERCCPIWASEESSTQSGNSSEGSRSPHASDWPQPGDLAGDDDGVVESAADGEPSKRTPAPDEAVGMDMELGLGGPAGSWQHSAVEADAQPALPGPTRGGTPSDVGGVPSPAPAFALQVPTKRHSKDSLRQLQHLPLFNRILPPWQSGRQMLRWCVAGTLSYVVVGAFLAVFGSALLLWPVRDDHKVFIWQVAAMVLSTAQAVAIFSLAELAVNVREEIAPLRPYGKFLSVKFVVFFAFWQGLLLRGLEKLGAFRPFERGGEGCGEHCAVEVVQNVLVCIEMLAASIIHFYVFPPYDFLRLLAQNLNKNGELTPQTLGSPRNFVEIVDIRDIFHTAWRVHKPYPARKLQAQAGQRPLPEHTVGTEAQPGSFGSFGIGAASTAAEPKLAVRDSPVPSAFSI